ncbi:MAG TPA: nitrate/sulfonate/bicarbonate ABC transporter ATP-binding protein [Candidatus Omnitrophica bacterium]|nr:MAG: nitrate/sulfonate/bicarbonate ABC transporter ATP-binding protein [Omnitrophica WOR_2 bacterium GWA2_63_20]OGX17704.1 MAG: nitrate/sulfonate/bicarbonate ABC transporter ATP-binding protein [Omnitrophica WOR_2 bacterium GWF2_63_9]OGX32376.1 MAG: nitrate/sulfonate/bicarbonate ABC transporter ATP-binding protein [Omnitrophica WOR_2 bacterium RIFCSPHIGHO2_12_FULL_64_13]OGX36203.1 MAG: nitrate/sulfonate/bicarbonate ABC transporter ATP-binding protein [Omnitrophica WOR_2 bacterium RIFCSPHIGHO2
MRVELRHIFKSFPHNGSSLEVLHDINLTVAEGEFVCLVGPSGCGKSTIIHLVAGLERPTSGDILVGGRPVTGPDPSRTVVFQDAALFPWLNVLGNVEFGLRMAGLPPVRRRARALEYLKLVHLSRFTTAYPHQLSGGMKQRAAIARALALQPEILLLDEPFAALDAQTRAVLQNELMEIWELARPTILFVTHNVREATGLADRVYVISSRPGQIRDVQAIHVPRPRHAEDAALLAHQHKILELLGEEVEKVLQDELGERVHFPEAQHPVPPEQSRGMHS